MTTTLTIPCPTHPTRAATHECTGCGKMHCEACLETLPTLGRSDPMRMCPSCGALARKIPEPAPSLKEGLRRAVMRPFDEEGLILIAALSLPYWITALPFVRVFVLGYLVYIGCLSAIYFQTVDHVGRGVPGLPFSASPGSRWELFLSLLRGLLCVGVGFGPAMISAIAIPGEWFLPLALLLIGIASTPAVILSIALTGNALNGLNPLAWWTIVTRDLRAYGQLVGLFFASSLAGLLAVTIADYTVGLIPFLGRYLVGVVFTSAALVQASLVGHWLHEIGWMEPD